MCEDLMCFPLIELQYKRLYMYQCGKQLRLLTGLTLLASNLYVFKRAKCPFKLSPGKTQ